MIAFTIPGPPVPKGRPRFYNGHAVTPERTRTYEAKARAAARVAMAKRGPLADQLAVTIRFFVHDARARDLDNLAKAVTDAANGVVYWDDAQIVEMRITKAIDRKNPRAEVEVRAAA